MAVNEPREYWRDQLGGKGSVRVILRSERIVVGTLIEVTDRGITLEHVDYALWHGQIDTTVPQRDWDELDNPPKLAYDQLLAFIPWSSIELIVREPDEPMPQDGE